MKKASLVLFLSILYQIQLIGMIVLPKEIDAHNYKNTEHCFSNLQIKKSNPTDYKLTIEVSDFSYVTEPLLTKIRVSSKNESFDPILSVTEKKIKGYTIVSVLFDTQDLNGMRIVALYGDEGVGFNLDVESMFKSLTP